MFAAEIILVGVLIAGVLICAWAFELDLGIRTPTSRGVWPWIVLFVLWCGVVTALDAVGPKDATLEWMREHSLLQIIISGVLVFPLFEELLFIYDVPERSHTGQQQGAQAHGGHLYKVFTFQDGWF